MTGPRQRLIRWLKFNAVGGMGICVQLAALTLLRSGFGWNYLISTAFAVEVTVIHNFLAPAFHLVGPVYTFATRKICCVQLQ